LTVSDPRPEDNIIDEVRRHREALLRASSGSLDDLYAMLKWCESMESREVVTMPPRKVGGSESDAA
jgi:hypothetical protein